MTSKNWQQYYEKKENLKKEQEETKKKRLEERRKKKEIQEQIKAQKLQKPKRKTKKAESSDSDSDESWVESGDSLDDISFNFSKDPRKDDCDEINLCNKSDSEDEVPLARIQKWKNVSGLKEGEFVVVLFPGNKKQHKYVCVIEAILPNDEAEVVGMKKSSVH